VAAEERWSQGYLGGEVTAEVETKERSGQEQTRGERDQKKPEHKDRSREGGWWLGFYQSSSQFLLSLSSPNLRQ
jgi:hypothetical protein